MSSIRRILRPVRRLARNRLERPRDVQMGEGSYIRRPYQIHFPHRLKIGKNCTINPNSLIFPLEEYRDYRYSPTITIGDNVYIGNFVHLAAIDAICIEDGCVLSDYVHIIDVFHGVHPDRGPIMDQPLESKGSVHIGRNCFLGFRVSVMPGVTLGEHCVVGENSVVTHSFPAYSMVAGSPAKLVKQFSQASGTWVDARLL